MKNLLASFFGAMVFYTVIPSLPFFPLNFCHIARWLTFIGVILGLILSVFYYLLTLLHFPLFTQGILMVAMAIYLTGGFHLDGLMDTADGFAVMGDREKSLLVMRDSRVGAFGVITAIIVILLKVVALGEMTFPVDFALILALSWSRWGQFVAIALYPYVREEGKGKFLQEGLNLPSDMIFSSLFIFPLVLWEYFYLGHSWQLILIIMVGCSAIALLTGWYLQRKLGGHTGDTYGATVEWSEAIILCLLTIVKL